MRYDAILIDADDTLLDFRAAEKCAIGELIARWGIEDEGAADVYSAINLACWKALERGEITQAHLRVRRFSDFLARYGVPVSADEASEQYAEALSRQRMLLPGALDAVREIAAELPVAVVTNGIADIQHSRLGPSPLKEHISALVISGEVGFQKPDPRMIFRALQDLGGIAPERALMVGDSLTSDVRAANRAGVDACWLNPDGGEAPAEFRVQYQIRDIGELPAIALQGE